MRSPHRIWHALFGHKNLYVDLAGEHWTASCDCGFQFRVREFTMSKIGAP